MTRTEDSGLLFTSSVPLSFMSDQPEPLVTVPPEPEVKEEVSGRVTLRRQHQLNTFQQRSHASHLSQEELLGSQNERSPFELQPREEGDRPPPLRVLLGVTGSVATVKLAEIVKELHSLSLGHVEIRVVATEKSKPFLAEDVSQIIDEDTGERLVSSFHTDQDEWGHWHNKPWYSSGDPILHIELRRWADVLCIAPLDANTLAKLALGICDNLLTCVARAWEMSPPGYHYPASSVSGSRGSLSSVKKRVIVCPAMNTAMWEHPLTRPHVRTLVKVLGYEVVPPVSKQLACGDTGVGGLASPHDIALRILGLDVLAGLSRLGSTYHPSSGHLPVIPSSSSVASAARVGFMAPVSASATMPRGAGEGKPTLSEEATAVAPPLDREDLVSEINTGFQDDFSLTEWLQALASSEVFSSVFTQVGISLACSLVVSGVTVWYLSRRR